MRTKTLLLTAALSAAGVATSMAQAVYSVNSVGYVNVTLQGGAFNLVANPLDAADNSIPALFAGVPNNTTVFKFDPATGYKSWIHVGGNWLGSPAASGVTIEPGEAAFVKLPAGSADTQITFVGEVPQGTLSQAVPTGLSLQASQVPQAGGVSTDLGFPAQANDTIFTFDPETGYTSKLFAAGNWLGGEPQIEVAEGFFVRRQGAAGTWTRDFSVNDQ